jgi:hypothetical protein
MLCLLASLGFLGRVASVQADTRQVGPFLCRADFSLAEIDGVLNELAQLQADLSRTLAVPGPREPVDLYLFHDKAAYTRCLDHYLPNLPYRKALYVKDRGTGKVFAHRSRDFQTDLRHECTHALLHAALPMVPLWLDEGLAGYFEMAPEKRASGNPHLESIRWSLQWGTGPSLPALEQQTDVAKMGRTQYRDSWAWVHFMLHGPEEAHQELLAFLADIRRGTPPGLLSQRLEKRLPGLQQRFAQHFRQWNRR